MLKCCNYCIVLVMSINTEQNIAENIAPISA